MLVDQVEWVPLEVNSFVKSLRFSVGVEGLVQKVVQVEVETLLEALVGHVLARVGKLEMNKTKMANKGTYPP
mgnify:CR=1 FL=1